MATPIIQSNGTSSGLGTAGEGRNDLVISETVGLSDTEPLNSGASYLWTFENTPVGSSTTMINATTATPSFVPDITGSYRILCTVDGADTSVEVLAVPLPKSGGRIPSFEEELEYDEGGNAEGWHYSMTLWMRAMDGALGTGTGGATTLQDAYDAGSTINTAAGPVFIQRDGITSSFPITGQVWWNTTAATGGTQQQWSPVIYLAGNAWDGAASQLNAWSLGVEPVAGSGTTSANLLFQAGPDGAATSTLFTMTSGGQLLAPDGVVGAPSSSFTSDATSGFYRDGTSVAMSVGGLRAFNSSSGQVRFDFDIAPQGDYGIDLGNASRRFDLTYLGTTFIQPQARASGVLEDIEYTAPAHTGLTASTEVPSVLFDMSATKQWATGALASQSAFKILAPTYAFVGASVITDASTLHIDGPPIAGTNATITNPYVIQAAPDTDSQFVFGRMRVDSRVANDMVISHSTRTGSTEYALKHQITTGNTILSGGTVVALALNSTTKWSVNGTYFQSQTATGPALTLAAPSSTVPSVIPNRSDTTSGIGAGAAGEVNAITGGTEAVRWDASQDQINAGSIFLSNLEVLGFEGSGGNTYVRGNGADTVQLVTGGQVRQTWSANTAGLPVSTIQRSSVGVSSAGEMIGLTLINTSDAAAGAQQWSPMLVFEGQGWRTDATAETQEVLISMQLETIEGAANPSGDLVFRGNVNGAGYTEGPRITSNGRILLQDDGGGAGDDGTISSLGFTSDTTNRAGLTRNWANGDVYLQAPAGDNLFLGAGGNNILQVTSTVAGTTTAGTEALPAFFIDSDVDTGWWTDTADNIVFSTGATEAIRWNASQQTVVPNGTSALPSYAFSTNLGSGLSHTGSSMSVSYNGALALAFSTGATTVYTTVFQPNLADAKDLGSLTNRWRDVFANQYDLFEKAAAATNTAGHGQLWVKNDAAQTLYFTDDAGTDFPIGGALASSGGLTALSVANIDDPSTELNAIAGSAKGDTRLVYQTVAGTDSWTLYAWDDADSGSEAVPFKVDGSSGMWVAIAGKYVNGEGTLNFGIAGSNEWKINSTNFESGVSTGPALRGVTGAATTPNHLIARGDSTTGMGGASGEVSLITGGNEGLRVNASQQVMAIEGAVGTPTYSYIGYGSVGTYLTNTGTTWNLTVDGVNSVLNATGTTMNVRATHRPSADNTYSSGSTSRHWSYVYSRQYRARFNAIGTAETAGIDVQNITDAADGAQQYSPMIVQEGQGWKADVTTDTYWVRLATQTQPVQANGNPYLEYKWKGSIENVAAGAYSDLMTLKWDGTTDADLVLMGGNSILTSAAHDTTGLQINGNSDIRLIMAGSGRHTFTALHHRISAQTESAAAPSLQWTDANSGLYRSAASEVAVSTGGTQAIRWDASQHTILPQSSRLVLDTDENTYFVCNADDQLAIYVGAGQKGLVTGSASTWLVANNVQISAFGTSQTVGQQLLNVTAAAAGAQQWSPMSVWEGQGWKTDATAGSQEVLFALQNETIQGAANPSGDFVLKQNINGAGYGDLVAFHSGGGITAVADTDADFIFGRVRMEVRTTDEASWSHYDQTATHAYAIKQQASGRTFINAPTGQDILFLIQGVGIMNVDNAKLHANAASSPALMNEAASSTNPTLIPNRTSETTGIGANASGEVSIITGATEAARWNASQNMTFFGALLANNGSGPAIRNEATSATNPVFNPTKAAATYGIGGTSTTVSAITNSVERQRWSANTTGLPVSTIYRDSIITGEAVDDINNVGLALTNTTAATTGGNEQHSPILMWQGEVFETSSQTTRWTAQLTEGNAGHGEGSWGSAWSLSSFDSGGWAEMLKVHSYINDGDAAAGFTFRGDLRPHADSDHDLGTSSVRWKELFIDDITVTATITAAGDIDAAGGFRRTLQTQYLSSPAQSTTYTMKLDGSLAGLDSLGWFVIPRAGSVVEISAWADADVAAGQIDFWVESSTDGGDTWGNEWGSSGAPIMSLDSATNPETNAAAQAKDTSTVTAGTVLRIRAATDGSFSASRTIYAAIGVEC